MKGKKILSVFIAAACLLMSFPTAGLAAENDAALKEKTTVSITSGDAGTETEEEPEENTDESDYDESDYDESDYDESDPDDSDSDDGENVTEDGWKYEKVAVKDENDSYIDGIGIIGHTEPIPNELVFPSEINGQPVLAVGTMYDDGFRNCETIKSIVIPDSVKIISSDAFNECKNLKSVKIGDGVTTIGSYAFYNCLSLSDLQLGSSLEVIEHNAFVYCKSLKIIKFGTSVKEIGQDAFRSCSGLLFAVILNKDCAIYDESSTIDNMLGYDGFIVGYPGSTAEEYANKYDNRFLDVNKCDLDELDKLNELPITFAINKDDNGNSFATITGYTSGISDELVIPADIMGIPVKKIGGEAFKNCEKLKSVTIPEGVTIIGWDAFSNCTSLTEIVIPESVEELSTDSFENTPWLEAKKAEYPLLIINQIVLDGKACKGDVIIPDGVRKIGSLAFDDCQAMTSVTIPEGVTVLDYSAFSGCTGLTSVLLPDSLEEIGMAAFRDCTGLKSIEIPNSVTGCGSWVFSGCTSIESITLGDNIEEFLVWGSAGHCGGCTSLATITVSENNKNLTSEDGILFSKDKTQLRSFPCAKQMTKYTVPASVTEIGFGAFANSKYLEKVILPENVNKVNGAAFMSCEKLQSLIIMNKDCEIAEMSSTVCNILDGDYYGNSEGTYNGVIIGYPDSTAKEFADKNGYKFDDIANYDITSDEDTQTDTAADTSSETDTDTTTDISSETETDTTTDTSSETDTVLDTETDTTTDVTSDTDSDTSTDSTPDTPKPDFKPDEKKDWSPEQSEGLVLDITNADITDLTEVTVNGEKVDQSNYTVTKTDTGVAITINPEFLKTLASGTYNLSAVFANGTAETQITVENTPEAIRTLGDLDGDEEITAADALFVLRASVEMEELTPEQTKLADIDGDGEITAGDALAVLRYSVDLADEDSPINKPITD